MYFNFGDSANPSNFNRALRIKVLVLASPKPSPISDQPVEDNNWNLGANFTLKELSFAVKFIMPFPNFISSKVCDLAVKEVINTITKKEK